MLVKSEVASGKLHSVTSCFAVQYLAPETDVCFRRGPAHASADDFWGKKLAILEPRCVPSLRDLGCSGALLLSQQSIQYLNSMPNPCL